MRGLLFMCLLLGVGLVACAAMRPEYSVVLKNDTQVQIYDGNVRYGRFQAGGGAMPPSGTSGHGGVRFRIPKKATVEWRTPDGVLHQEEVTVRSHVPRGFAGELIFTIRDDGGVDFRAETWAEQDKRVEEEMRRNPPVFEDGELEIDSANVSSNPFTKGLTKWSHPELEASTALSEPWELLVELATRIKRDGARYVVGDRVEVNGQAVCFSEVEEGRLLVEPCAAPEPSS